MRKQGAGPSDKPRCRLGSDLAGGPVSADALRALGVGAP
jgi:hypothetical protein